MTEGAADQGAEGRLSRAATAASKLGAHTLRYGRIAAARLRRDAKRLRVAATRLRRTAAVVSPTRAIVFSSLTARIFTLTIGALCIQLVGVLYVSDYRSDLIELKLDSLETEAEIIAITVAELALEADSPDYDPLVANAIVRRLTLPTGLRAQIYDRSGRLTGDTRGLFGGSIIVETDVSPPSSRSGGALGMLETMYEYAVSLFTPQRPLYRETPPAGITLDREVYAALTGKTDSAERVNSEDELILSVAVPVKRVRTVVAALVLSTEGGDIDQLADEGRDAILSVFGVSACVLLMLSVAVAHTIARPIRQLARAAERSHRRERGPLDPKHVNIPDLSRRGDEIGNLSVELRRMTAALFERIAAIENFAADVSHEIKNPLTSLRSAVEVMSHARTDEQRSELLKVIQHDVRRMDRLVTEISNASRLDAELVREERQRIDLVEMLKMVVSISEGIFEGRDVRIKLSTERDRVLIKGLEQRLPQVFHNLLDNAASFSPPDGLIHVALTPTKLAGSDAWLVAISDEGPGVPPDNVESIFQRFYSERPEDHGFGNHSGLGLSICRQIIEAHRGRIWCENRTDRSGAIFFVALPA